MNLKSILFGLLAFATLSVQAQNGMKPRKPVTKPITGQELTPVKPVPADTFSYAIGLLQGPSLKQYLTQQEQVDTACMDQVVLGMTQQFSEADANRIIALAAGLKVAKMNRERVMPSINEQATGKADSTYLDASLYNEALAASLLGRTQKFSNDDAQKIVEQQMNYTKETYRAANVAFLEANKTKPGVKTLPSGLQYKVLVAGKGAVPSDTSNVEVNYEGRLIDGKVFDSSYERGKTTTFPVNGVIKGWTEALKLMPEGSKWELYIPQELAYGERGTGRDIPGYSTLIFKVELVNANAPKDQKKPHRR